MHVALLSGEYPPQVGGVGDYTDQLAQALAAQGVRVSVITGAPAAPHAPLTAQAGHVWRVHSGWGWPSWREVFAAVAALAPDVLHIQYQTGAYGMHPAINLLPHRLQALPFTLPVCVTMHDLLEPYLFPKAHWLGMRQWVTRRLVQDATAVLATNPADAAALRQLRPAPASPPAIIPIGTNIAVAPPPAYQREAWRAQWGLSAHTPVIAYFGLASPAKGLSTLLDAVSLLPDAALLIIGGAPDPQHPAFAAQLQARLQALQASGRQIITTGHVAPPHVSAHLLAADVVALPFAAGASFRSGSLLAALAHGQPIVTTHPTAPPVSADIAPDFPRLMDGQNVLLVAPHDSVALAHALRRVLRDAALRAQLGHAAQQLAAHFTWPQIAAQHQALYARLCG